MPVLQSVKIPIIGWVWDRHLDLIFPPKVVNINGKAAFLPLKKMPWRCQSHWKVESSFPPLERKPSKTSNGQLTLVHFLLRAALHQPYVIAISGRPPQRIRVRTHHYYTSNMVLNHHALNPLVMWCSGIPLLHFYMIRRNFVDANVALIEVHTSLLEYFNANIKYIWDF